MYLCFNGFVYNRSLNCFAFYDVSPKRNHQLPRKSDNGRPSNAPLLFQAILPFFHQVTVLLPAIP